MASSRALSSKAGGERAETNVLAAVSELEYVPDTEAEHYDARTTTLLEPRDGFDFAGVPLVGRGTPIEIKSAMVYVGESQQFGRFYLRQGQHEQLVAAAAMYLFAVVSPTPERTVVRLGIVPAVQVSDLVASWIDVPADRSETAYAQLRWTWLWEEDAVLGGESA
jgi:hypothetical protein